MADERSRQCRAVTKKYNDCNANAHNTYRRAIAAGPDGRDDFKARKSCNYLQESIEECGNLLLEGNCKTEEEITEMKDKNIRIVMKQLQTTVYHWDSEKCPAIKAHIDRMKALEEPELPEPTEEPEVAEEKPEPEPEEPEDDYMSKGSMVAASGLVLVISARILI